MPVPNENDSETVQLLRRIRYWKEKELESRKELARVLKTERELMRNPANEGNRQKLDDLSRERDVAEEDCNRYAARARDVYTELKELERRLEQ